MVNVCMLKSAKKAARSRVFYSLKISSTTLNVKRWLVFVKMVLEFSALHIYFYLYVQQGLEIRGFWFQKKTVYRKTVLREVYIYVLNEIFFQKTVYFQGFCSKSVFCKVTPMY